jgi:hypothetical protein
MYFLFLIVGFGPANNIKCFFEPSKYKPPVCGGSTMSAGNTGSAKTMLVFLGSILLCLSLIVLYFVLYTILVRKGPRTFSVPVISQIYDPNS